MSCAGSGCPGGRPIRSRGRLLSLDRSFHRDLGSGATITLRATRNGSIGRLARLTFRSGKSPLNEQLCLVPHKRRLTKCT